MNALIYDKNAKETELLQSILSESQKEKPVIYKTGNIWEAMKITEQHGIDLMLITFQSGLLGDDDDRNEMSFARLAIQKRPNANLIFLSDDSKHAMDAFSLDASGYLLRPVTKSALLHQLERLRYPVGEKNKKVRFRCFGNFEVYVNDQLVKFQYSKTKEILAYLVDRHGGLCTMGEIMSVLWQDDNNHISYFKTIRKDMYDTLEALDCLELIQKQRNRIGLRLELCECDYYDWENSSSAPFPGEYMSQYSWAEFTTGLLMQVREEAGR